MHRQKHKNTGASSVSTHLPRGLDPPEQAEVDQDPSRPQGEEHLPIEGLCSPNATAGLYGCVVPVVPA